MLKLKSLILTGLLLNSIANADTTKLVTEILPPYQMKIDDNLTGLGVDVIKILKEKVGNKNKIATMPWNRAYNLALKKEGYAVFLTARNAKRENNFKWVGPIVDVEINFFKSAENKKEFLTEDDAKGANSVGVDKNGHWHHVLTKKGYKNLQVKTRGTREVNIQRLIDRTVELVPMGFHLMTYMLKQQDKQGQVVASKIPPFKGVVLYMAFNKNTNDTVIKKWQDALDEIKSDGTYSKIIDKYNH